MATTANGQKWGKRLVNKMTCPNCWHGFPPAESLFISRHPDLVGDPVAGGNEPLRFEPMRFNVEGEALDERGFPSSDLACPHCHLPIPEAMLTIPVLFISIVGAPASGKSYFLASMIWGLRTMLPGLGFLFTDVDPSGNSPIYEYERTLFDNPNPERHADIRKTQRDDPQLYRTAFLNGASMRYPIPLQFSLRPTPKHPYYGSADKLGRLVVMYDNAGEDFLPGTDEGDKPVVQHLARSQVVFVFFDPTQDQRFAARCSSDDPQLREGLDQDRHVTHRQETLLREAAVRARRKSNVPQEHRFNDKILVILVSKADIWGELLDEDLAAEPYVPGDDQWPMGMDVHRVERTSEKLRDLLNELCPEFVASAESFVETVLYIPVSALGASPEAINKDGQRVYSVRPITVNPKWVTVPLLYCLCRHANLMIKPAHRLARKDGDA